MATRDRWETAQSYEKGYWEGIARNIAAGDAGGVDFYRWRADQLSEWLTREGRGDILGPEARILEVGGGPVGLVSVLEGSRRLSVDPLADVYGADEHLSSLRQDGVEYVAAPGEEVPAENDAFDLVIIENCIDHVLDMDSVMDELFRVLRPGGTLYLTVNARCLPGFFVHRVLSKLRLDPGHPHTMTPPRAARLVERAGFRIVDLKSGSFWRAWIDDWRGSGFRPRAKAALGVSEYVVSILAEKRQA